jgi:hypothetical protein
VAVVPLNDLAAEIPPGNDPATIEKLAELDAEMELFPPLVVT